MGSPARQRSDASVGAGTSGTAVPRGRGSGFEWVAPAPSPAVVAELERRYPEIVQVPMHSLEIEEERWGSHAIIARCLSRWIPPEIIVREFHRAGLTGEIDALALANKHYIFNFSDIRAKDLALGRPWVVNGQPIITAAWSPEFVPVDSSIHTALLWIRLPQLPIEFWSDEILSSILAVAGQFLFSDDSTKARKRGSFARACVRVDLSTPLRPGTRIRGSRDPFWQQFSYENLEGICVDCGTVHLSGSCQAVPDSSSSSPAPGFGPWMAAIRRRKLSQEPPSGDRLSTPRSFPASADGWQSPKKPARRQLSRGTALLPPLPSVELKSQGVVIHGEKTVSSLPPLAAVDPGSEDPGTRVEKLSEPLTGELAVPVGTVAKFQQTLLNVSNVANVSNPFSCLESNSMTVQPKSRVDGYSGPSKRTRAVEPVSQRVISKATKGKGKSSGGRNARSQGSFTFLATTDSSRGSLDLTGPGKKKSRRKEGPGLQSSPGLSLPTQKEDVTHDSAVLLLKKAILRGEEAEAVDSSRSLDSVLRDVEVVYMDSLHSEDCRGKEPVVGSLTADDHLVDELMGDRAAPHPTHALE